MTYDKLIIKSINHFNEITPKKKININKSFSNLDSMDVLNLTMCIEEVFNKNGINLSIPLDENLAKNYKNFQSLKKFIKIKMDV